MPLDYSQRDSFECPHCGDLVPAGAKMCRECGADADCGWTDGGFEGDGHYEEEEFDYDAFVAREFPQHAENHIPHGQSLWKPVILLLIVVSLLLGMML